MRIDKGKLYGTWNESIKRNHKLQESAFRKAHDLPQPDEMDINSRIYNFGGLAVVAAVLVTGVVMWLAGVFGDRKLPPPTDPVELEIEFKREDGEWKTIPRRVE